MIGKIKTTMKEVISKIEELVKEGNLKRVIINDQNGDKYLEVPMIVGVVFTIAAPIVTIIAAIAGFSSRFTIEIISKNQSNDSCVYEVVKNEE